MTTTRLIQNVDSLFGLFNLEVISLVDMSGSERIFTLESFLKSKSMEQLEEVCQQLLDEEYLKSVLRFEDVSHIMLLKVKDLVVAHSFLSEKTAPDGRLFMEIKVLCSRKLTSTGKQMLLAAENLSLRRGITFTKLSSVFEAIGFYERLGYKTVPIKYTCGPPNQNIIGDTAILEVFKEAKSIIDSHFVESGNVLSDENFEKNTSRILLKLRFTRSQIAFIITHFNNRFSIWESILRTIVDLGEYFDNDGLLFMSKCLINSETIGIFNTGI